MSRGAAKIAAVDLVQRASALYLRRSLGIAVADGGMRASPRSDLSVSQRARVNRIYSTGGFQMAAAVQKETKHVRT